MFWVLFVVELIRVSNEASVKTFNLFPLILDIPITLQILRRPLWRDNKSWKIKIVNFIYNHSLYRHMGTLL